MTNSNGSGILGFRLCGVPAPDFLQGLASVLILAHHYSKPRVRRAELLRAGLSVPLRCRDYPLNKDWLNRSANAPVMGQALRSRGY